MTPSMRAPRGAPSAHMAPRPVHYAPARPAQRAVHHLANKKITPPEQTKNLRGRSIEAVPDLSKLDCKTCWQTIAIRIEGLEGRCKCKEEQMGITICEVTPVKNWTSDEPKKMPRGASLPKNHKSLIV